MPRAIKIALFFCVILSPAQIFSQSFSSPLVFRDSFASFFDGKENWIELPEYREQHRLAYKTPDGRIIFQYSKANLCYLDKEGKFSPVNIALKAVEGKYGEEWVFDQQQFPQSYTREGLTSVHVNEKEEITFNKNCSVNGIDLIPQFELGTNSVHSTYHTWDPGTDNFLSTLSKNISFRENVIESDYIIDHYSSLLHTGLIFSEEIEFPQEFSLREDNSRVTGERLKDGSWQGDLVVISEQGFEMARFRMPLYRDANYSFQKGSYKFSGAQGKYKLEMIVPQAWLNDPHRVFPLTIDPLVTGPTSTWPGGMMPSCLLPNYNVDSILVTVPPQVTITSLMLQGSFEADVNTNTPKSDGRLYFSTTCGMTPVMSVTGPNGQLPGTAYLAYTNYQFPLMCCHQSSCAGYSFYLRMHLGRANQGAGCNTSYIYYDPASLWPFSAYVEGHTVESYGQNWTVTPTTLCSDVCSLTMKAFVRYGVPPYTITHPWASGGPITVGNNIGCNTGAVQPQLTLTIPNCPAYCGNVHTLSVPPPVITDACGNTVSGLTPKNITINPTPLTTANNVSQNVCSGDLYSVLYTSCVNNSTFSWSTGTGPHGNGNVLNTSINNTTVPDTIFYYTTATSPQGCTGPPDTAMVIVNPYPVADAGTDQQIETGQTVTLNGSGGTSYSWAPPTWLSCTNCPSPDATPLATTAYVVYVTENGCTSTDTVVIDVIFPPLDIFVPNAFTPDGNGVNDVLQVSLLGVADFEMHIFDRWGEEIYNWKGLNGSWDGTYKGRRVQEGVYVYLWHAVPSDLRYSPMEGTGTITVISNGKKQ